MEDFADLLRGAEDALADEVAEAGDVLEAGGGRAVAAEDADALPCGLGDLAMPWALAIVDWYQTSSSTK